MTRHVTHVVTPAPFGGLEQVVQSLATAQASAGCRVSVVAMMEHDATEPALLRHLREAEIPVHVIAHAPRGYRSAIAGLNRVLRRLQPDIIHTHGYVADVFVALLGVGARRTVTTVHGFTGGGMKNRVYEWMQRQSYRRFGGVVAVSQKLGRELIAGGLPAGRVHVVPNGFGHVADSLSASDARGTLTIPAAAFSIGWIGRVSHEKGLDVLIEALPGLRGLDWHLTVVGDGPERAALQARSATAPHAARIGWAGAVTAAARLIRAFDVVVISSRTEGTPMTLLEAMSVSVPVVTTAVGGIPDVVSDSEALLVPPSSPEALALAIRAVHDDPATAALRAARAHARLSSEYGLTTVVERYNRVYDAVSGLPR